MYCVLQLRCAVEMVFAGRFVAVAVAVFEVPGGFVVIGSVSILLVLPESLPSESHDESLGSGQPELKKDEGPKTFTMLEMLTGLKADQSQTDDTSPAAPDSASPPSVMFFGFMTGSCRMRLRCCQALWVP